MQTMSNLISVFTNIQILSDCQGKRALPNANIFLTADMNLESFSVTATGWETTGTAAGACGPLPGKAEAAG